MTYRAHFWPGWGVAVVCTGLLVLLSTLPPFVGEPFRTLLMNAFAAVCHQLPTRSPHAGGIQLAVCHRCYGMYWGFLLGAAGAAGLHRWDAALYRWAPVIIGVALVPMGLDWVGDLLGAWVNTPFSRMLTGCLFGMAAGYYFSRAVVEGFARRRVVRSTGSGPS